ncbi:MAG: DUF192 domain-containing protein [Patescibacteria group bacterium]|nr:DUF192 domain-containing protein [Patescibacteria group bacterium]
MKKILILFGALFVIALLGSYFSNYFKTNSFPFMKTPSVTIKSQKFSVTVAKTLKDTEIGLSEKTSLPQNQGMLFAFKDPGFYPFWMKKMKFPIDIIYINKNKIVTIFENAAVPDPKTQQIPIYKPETQANMVLEINAGLSKKYGFKTGDEVKTENL